MSIDPADLKPCPFCFSTQVSLSVGTKDEGSRQFFYIECEDCSGIGPFSDNSAEEAELSWNRRLAEDHRIGNARRSYDACREALENEHSRSMMAVSLLNHPVLLDLFGKIEDSGTSEASRLWPLVKQFVELRDEVIE